MPTQPFRRRSLPVLVLLGALAVPVGYGAWHAYDRRDNGVLGWLPERSPVTRAYRDFLRAFGPDESVLVAWEGCRLDDAALERLATAVETRIAAADAAASPCWFAAVTTGTRLRDQVARAADLDDAAAAARLTGVVVGPDGTSTCAVVTLHPLDDPGRAAAIAWLRAEAAAATGLAPEALRLTGDAVVSAALDAESERTGGTWSGLSMAVALALAWASLGSLRLGLMVMAVAGYASLAIEAVICASGGTMNMLVSLVPVVTFVVALSTAVHLLGYWRESLAEYGTDGAPAAAVALGWQPGAVALLTTVLGLASLCVSQVRPVWHFGLYGAIGATLAGALAFTALPALLWTFPPRTPPREPARLAALGLAARRLVARHRLLAPACLAVLVVAGAGLARIRTEVRPSRFLSRESRCIRDLEWFTARVGPFQTVDAVLEFPAAAAGLADRAALVQEAEARLAGLDGVRGSLSAATFLPDAPPGTADRGRVRSTMRRGAVEGRLRRNLPALVDAGVVAGDDHRQLWRISLQVAGFTAEKQAILEREIGRVVAASAADLDVTPPEFTRCTGGVPLVIAAQRELLDSLRWSFALALVTIAGVLAAFFRSIPAGIVAMIPNLLPTAVVFGALGWAGWPLDVGGMMTASVALGISVDDSAHLLTWFRRERGGRRERIDAALARSAVPIVRTSLVLAGGFGVLGFCGFQPVAQFGTLLALLLAVALVGDLAMLPALLAGPAGRLLGGGVEQHDAADHQGRADELRPAEALAE